MQKLKLMLKIEAKMHKLRYLHVVWKRCVNLKCAKNVHKFYTGRKKIYTKICTFLCTFFAHNFAHFLHIILHIFYTFLCTYLNIGTYIGINIGTYKGTYRYLYGCTKMCKKMCTKMCKMMCKKCAKIFTQIFTQILHIFYTCTFCTLVCTSDHVKRPLLTKSACLTLFLGRHSAMPTS